MKSKDIKSARGESEESIIKKIAELKKEITQLSLQQKTNPPKNTNAIGQKKRHVSILLTILKEKKLYGKTA